MSSAAPRRDGRQDELRRLPRQAQKFSHLALLAGFAVVSAVG
jgi:hypothetical protein